MEYRTVYQGGKGEIVEKKSRFIAEVFLVHSEEEAMQYLEQIRKKSSLLGLCNRRRTRDRALQ